MGEDINRATHQGILHIGDVEIPCFVLEDGTRVISGRGMTKAIGMKGRGQGAKRVTTHSSLKSYLGDELTLAIQEPIKFIGARSVKSNPTFGYEATILQKLCDAILTARDAGVLRTEQEKRYAAYSYSLIRAFAKVGIIALVDEATGYQEVRDRLALQEILDKYLLDERAAWAKRFPDEFYKQIFKLNGWPYNPGSVKRPQLIGTMTNDIVYSRLAPGVLDELKVRTPKGDKGRRKHRFHQWLTEDIGHPKLQEHLSNVIVLMKASSNYRNFYRLLQRAIPKIGENLPLDLPDE